MTSTISNQLVYCLYTIAGDRLDTMASYCDRALSLFHCQYVTTPPSPSGRGLPLRGPPPAAGAAGPAPPAAAGGGGGRRAARGQVAALAPAHQRQDDCHCH